MIVLLSMHSFLQYYFSLSTCVLLQFSSIPFHSNSIYFPFTNNRSPFASYQHASSHVVHFEKYFKYNDIFLGIFRAIQDAYSTMFTYGVALMYVQNCCLIRQNVTYTSITSCKISISHHSKVIVNSSNHLIIHSIH